MKYYKDDLKELQRRGFKRYKMELQQFCKNDSTFFSSYFIDLFFLSDYGSYLLRNMKPTTLNNVFNRSTGGDVEFDSKFECGNLYAAFKKVSENET